ncbi:MAG: site-specific DNA-methyltransferase [Deltaproteobacteria bacterium]|uniref:Methyltransferase n=1 Tax=Candidatus Zymogenus saltonus TaxID=2844893 RepID=A0A9D8KEA4_9DELT|nr:site-specific DNA-methyltransferase [Candidatus Zymogenus saltonus]
MKNIGFTSNFDLNANVVLFEGDCLDLLSQIPNGLIKLVVTSPPYNLGKPYEKRLDLEEYLNQQRKVIKECYRVLNDHGSICWQIGNFVDNGEIIPLDIVLYPIFSELGLKLRNRIVWHFGHGLHASKRFSGRYEVILWFTKGNDYTFNLDPIRVPQKYPEKKHFKGPKRGQLSGNPLGKNPTDIWEIPNVKANHIEKTMHPCQFPVELIERLVLAMTDEGDWVFDPFIGVGTTAIASIIHNRRAIGAEVMPEYIEIAKERLNLAEKGELKVRPIDRSVYDPKTPKKNIPPKIIKLWPEPSQEDLFEKEIERGREKK